MQIEPITFRSKSWGIIETPFLPGHFHTGYEKEWGYGFDPAVLGGRSIWDLERQYGRPNTLMQIGKNVIITGAFRIDGFSRGRSAANFHGHFKGHEKVAYDVSMDGTAELLDVIQDGKYPVNDGYIEGRYTFAKNGQSIFLKPYLGE